MICRKCHKEIQDGSKYCNMCGAKQERRNERKRTNGLGTVFKYRGAWRCEITLGYDVDGKRNYKAKNGFKTKKDALEYLTALKGKPNKDEHTLSYYYDSWASSDMGKLSKNKQTSYRIAWKKIEEIHKKKVCDISIVQLRDLVLDVAPTFYPARDIKSLLSHLFKLAIADQQVSVNMSEYITLPKQNESEQTPWSEDEIRVIWQQYEMGRHMAAYLLLMIYSGMMPGELFNCTKDAIDLDKLEIRGIGLKTDVRKKTPIVIPSILAPVIESIFTFTPSDYNKIVRRNRWDFYEDYHAFTASSGIRDLPMYSCRHTTATALAVGSSVAPSVIQKIMRHSKFTTTQRYIHPDTDDAHSGIETFERPML